jgi:dihydrofolate reductase
MSKITVFTHVSADGFFAGPNGEIDWFKAIQKDKDYDEFTRQQSSGGNALIFGRKTYEMMKSYWPTPDAIKSDPQMAEVVNHNQKFVFSKTLNSVTEEPNWKNIKLLHEIDPREIRKLKDEKEITILGSGSIVQQFANLGLIDEYELMIAPVVLGSGKSLFKDVKQMHLKLLEVRAFKNGIVMQRYRSA